MVKNRVTVLIPCYNGEKTIDRSIESVYEQNYADIELIVVNDGSMDCSENKIQAWIPKFREKGYTLRYLYQENKGTGAATNLGLKYVTGEFLTLLDADDRFIKGSVDLRANFLISHPEFSAVRSNGWQIRENQRWLFVQDTIEKKENIFELLVLGKTNNWSGSYMVRTEILWEYYPKKNIYQSRWGQNLQILLPVVYKKKCGWVDEPLMEYIQQAESLSRSTSQATFDKDIERIEGYFDIRKHILTEVIQDNMDDCISSAYIELLRNKLLLANQYKEISYARDTYDELKARVIPTLDDKILFYQVSKPAMAFMLRVLRKISKKLFS